MYFLATYKLLIAKTCMALEKTNKMGNRPNRGSDIITIVLKDKHTLYKQICRKSQP